MKTIPAALQTHIGQDTTTLAVCWEIVPVQPGTTLRLTSHDQSITIDSGRFAGTYNAAAGVTASDVINTESTEIDNLEAVGPLDDDLITTGSISALDLEAGIYDHARTVIFLVNWKAPNDGELILRAGRLGNTTREDEGTYRAELRGLTQALHQKIVDTYSTACRADLGDAQCQVDLEALKEITTIDSVISDRVLRLTALGQSAGYWVGGTLQFTDGNNSGILREIKDDDFGGTFGDIEIFEPFPFVVDTGDTVEIKPGCDKALSTCKNKFDNVVNFRGEPFIPGADAILEVGKR